MAIIASDIHYRMSGGASNTDPAAALGGAKSNTSFSTNAVFDDVSSAEAASGDTEYRCFYVHNNHGSLTLQGAKIWIETQTSSADTSIAIALAGEGKNGTAETITDENTAPSGETFSQPSNFAGGLTLGDLAPGEHYPVWVKRIVNASAASATDTWTIRVQGDTNP